MTKQCCYSLTAVSRRPRVCSLWNYCLWQCFLKKHINKALPRSPYSWLPNYVIIRVSRLGNERRMQISRCTFIVVLLPETEGHKKRNTTTDTSLKHGNSLLDNRRRIYIYPREHITPTRVRTIWAGRKTDNLYVRKGHTSRPHAGKPTVI